MDALRSGTVLTSSSLRYSDDRTMPLATVFPPETQTKWLSEGQSTSFGWNTLA
ncbi:MAG: hypothetical protein ACAF41_10140 [Leptolyngbya sp. BL-A-14]